MFEYVSGRLISRRGNEVIVDAGGIGYAIVVPASTMSSVPDPGNHIKVLIHEHTVVSGQQITKRLYGFATEEERDIFRNLISVSKVGPRLAIAIQSQIIPEQFAEMLSSDDPTRLKSVSGVGQKTALRIIVDLRSKLPQLTKTEAQQVVPEEAILALQSLGYSQYEVKKTVERLASKLGNDKLMELSTEDIITEALQL
jgi:Holliday junction DNA helicase RuvA